MTQLTLPMRPEEATKVLLRKLPSRRMRDVLEKRFGLKGGKKKTLEAIGREYKITRERVRQIEMDALKLLAKPESMREVEPIFASLEDHFRNNGEVVAEHHLFDNLSNSRLAPHVSFLLTVSKSFIEFPESSSHHRRWAISKNTPQSVEKVLERTAEDLETEGKPVPFESLQAMVAKHTTQFLGSTPSEHVRDAYIKTSKLIRMNPYGEYGLISWPTINPRGVKDKAYLVLSKSGKPLHFREVAGEINKMNWSKRKAHPQTVHNELIKDNRFVLVGRGLYGLKEWGYEPGTVRDILVSILKKAGKPLRKDEVMKLVLEKRFVKPPTVLLNLQDRTLFKKMDEDRYTLV